MSTAPATEPRNTWEQIGPDGWAISPARLADGSARNRMGDYVPREINKTRPLRRVEG